MMDLKIPTQTQRMYPKGFLNLTYLARLSNKSYSIKRYSTFPKKTNKINSTNQIIS